MLRASQIRAARALLGWRQEDLSEAAGIGAATIYRIEKGDGPVVGNVSTVLKIQAAFEHGVLGYIPKSSSVSQIINGIKVVLSGSNYIPPHFMCALGFVPPANRPKAKLPDSPTPKLTPRQQQVFAYLLQGMPNKVIADRLGMAEGTVKTHLFTIYRLFGASNRAQLILHASQLGLV